MITIEDADAKHTNEPELSLISDEKEWKFWVDKEGFPPTLDFLPTYSSTFALSAGEKTTLILKYLSFREFYSVG